MLHLTPPAVTMQVKELEGHVGMPLFERNGRKVALTTVGEYMLVYARKVLATLKDAEDAAARLQKLETGTLVIGMVSTAKYFVPMLLVQFAKLHQGIEVTLRVDNPNDFELNFSKLKYHMVAGDLQIATGVFDERISIPATSHAMIKLPLTVDSSNALKLAQDLLTKSEEVFAIMNATADFETPFGAMEVNFEDKHALKKLAGF